MNELVRVENLVWQVQGRNIVDVERFSIDAGENVAIIGENGSGKSSFVKLIALLQQPSSGNIYYRGNLCGMKSLDIRREISTVFQEPLLLKGTVYDNVALGLKIRKVPKPLIREKVDRWLETFNISHLKKQNVRGLSGGESQRVSLARAMVTEPRLLILDEPFSSLDAPARAGIVQDFCEVLRKSSLATIFITHNVTEIPLMSDRVCVFDGGKIIEEGPPARILNYPGREVTAGLVGIENIFRGKIVEKGKEALYVECEGTGRLRTGNHYDFPRGTGVKILIRPDMVEVGHSREYNSYKYRIKKIYPLHGHYKLYGGIPFDLIVLVGKDAFVKNELATGKEIDIFIPEEGIHLIKDCH